MPWTLRILADDLTGALDTAAGFAGEVPVSFDRPPPQGASDAPVSAVATTTRDVPRAALAPALSDAIAWLRAASVAYKKVDSLLRGNTLAEVAHVAMEGQFERIVLAPALPQQGRLTQQGRLVLLEADGVVLGKPSEPLGPTLMDLLKVELTHARVSVRVPDVASDVDLDRLLNDEHFGATAPEAGARTLWCGSAGLAQAMARHLHRAPRPGAPRQEASKQAKQMKGCGAVWVVSASHHPATRRQWPVLTQAWPHAVQVHAGDATTLRQAIDPASPQGLAFFDLSPRERLSAADATHRLAAQLAQLVVSRSAPDAVLVVGGDTVRALGDALGAHGLMARTAPRAGWGLGRWMGGRWDGVDCHARSGAFGGDEDLHGQLEWVMESLASLKRSAA